MSYRKPRKRRLLTASRFYLALPLALVLLLLVITIILIVVHIQTKEIGYLIALIVVVTVFLAAFVFLSNIILKNIHSIYHDRVFKTVVENMDKFTKNDSDLKLIETSNIDELEYINDKTKEIKDRLANAYIVVRNDDYSNIELDYINKEKRLITFESFKKNINGIIFVSQSFRNVLIDVYFKMGNHRLEQKEKDRLFDIYFNLFKDYKNSLFILDEEADDMLIYLPVIDSFSRIVEQLQEVASDSSTIIRDIKGLETVNARYAIVAYPYSSEEYLLSDLRYAKRQDKTFNLFLPNRTKNNVDQQVIMNTSMNINYMSKLIAQISVLEYNPTDNDKNKAVIKTLLTDLSNYLDIDEAGILYLDNQATLNYQAYVETDNSVLFKGNNCVDPSLIDALVKAADGDGSYYFSKRKNANSFLGRQLDYYGITSGYYYVIKNEEKTVGIIYLFNRHKELKLDSYLRESFFIIGLRISHYFEKKEILDNTDIQQSEKEYILSMSDFMTYTTDTKYNLLYVSNDMKRKFSNIKLGEKCHKVFYDLDKPCYNCPLRTFKKKEETIQGDEYEISLILNDRKRQVRSLLLKHIKDEEEKTLDLFEKDYLTYSYYSLFNTLKNAYVSSARGYVLLLSLDNNEDFIKSQGSEGYLFATRCLIRNIKNKLKTNEVYLYNPTTLAVVFPYTGHADVITKCEQIYEITKEHYLDDGSVDQFKVTYLPLGYPRGYASVEDFVKHISDFYHSDKYIREKDFIYFSDYSISRSASKRDFMVSVIESEFSSQSSTSVNLQPIIQVSNRHIYGAEILLRINDAHRNVFFNAEEISRIAEQENMTHLITESIINFVGNMYQEHGKTTFKNNEFSRIAINIDQTYLRDPTLIKNVIDLCEKNNLPNNFISFEIPEDMIPDNIDKIKKFAEELKNYHIYFSCDRFTGQYVGCEKLKDLGFNEVKMARDLVFKIDKDPLRLSEVKDIVNNALNLGINVAAVGVENEAQYRALRDMDPNMVVQGYYFYKPLTRSDLISAIISYKE